MRYLNNSTSHPNLFCGHVSFCSGWDLEGVIDRFYPLIGGPVWSNFWLVEDLIKLWLELKRTGSQGPRTCKSHLSLMLANVEKCWNSNDCKCWTVCCSHANLYNNSTVAAEPQTGLVRLARKLTVSPPENVSADSWRRSLHSIYRKGQGAVFDSGRKLSAWNANFAYDCHPHLDSPEILARI